MPYKWIGTLLIVISCCGTGISLAADHKREEALLNQMLSALAFMKSQLQYQLTPLPQLFRQTAKQCSGQLRSVFQTLAQEMEQQLLPEASDCMHATLKSHPDLPPSLRFLCRELGHSLGQLDLNGQLEGLELTHIHCLQKYDQLSRNRDQRLRSYQTLSLCAGAALAILLI